MLFLLQDSDFNLQIFFIYDVCSQSNKEFKVPWWNQGPAGDYEVNSVWSSPLNLYKFYFKKSLI